MRFRIERSELAGAAAWVGRSLPARPAAPVLAGILVEASEGRVVLSGFDYEVSTRVELKADVERPGRVLLPGRRLTDTTKLLPAGTAEVALERNRVHLECGDTAFTLNTLPAADYPALPEPPPTRGLLQAGLFAEAVNQVAIASGRDVTLPELTGVRLAIGADTLTLDATDRYRLALRTCGWAPDDPGYTATALVPARTLLDVVKPLSGAEPVRIGLDDRMIGFESGGRRTTCRLLDNRLPDTSKLFPVEFASFLTLDTEELTAAVKRVSVVAERNSPVRLIVRDGVMTVEAGSGDDDLASARVPAQLAGEEIRTGFNPGYLLDGLAAVGTPGVRLALTSTDGKTVITGVGEDGEEDVSYRYLVMPMRVRS